MNETSVLLTSANVFADNDRAPTTGTRLPNTQFAVRSVTSQRMYGEGW